MLHQVWQNTFHVFLFITKWNLLHATTRLLVAIYCMQVMLYANTVVSNYVQLFINVYKSHRPDCTCLLCPFYWVIFHPHILTITEYHSSSYWTMALVHLWCMYYFNFQTTDKKKQNIEIPVYLLMTKDRDQKRHEVEIDEKEENFIKINFWKDKYNSMDEWRAYIYRYQTTCADF